MSMRRHVIAALVLGGLLTGCNGEPSYQGFSFVAYNYTPWDLDAVQITDSESRSAGTGSIGPGGGEGTVTCCFTLRGTDFAVKWSGLDGEEAIRHLYDGKMDELFFHKEARVHFPASDLPPGTRRCTWSCISIPTSTSKSRLAESCLGKRGFRLLKRLDGCTGSIATP